MTRRYESLFAPVALLLLLPGLMLLDGCRAFDPAPVIVNRPPDTFVTGAPAETTGTRFRRHMYWYGNDVDGEVVRFIWAITDSTVRDQRRPDEDEEDSRFNPALDVTTLTEIPGRTVGYTDRSDSTFIFTIDRAFTPAKDITFHIVSVDDRGAVDPSPARLHFLNNSLGNPELRFTVYTEEDTGTADPWVLRWVGTPFGAEPGANCEDSDQPFVGFGSKFRVEWEASSPNGRILGYRFLASQDSRAAWTPADIGGDSQFCLGVDGELPPCDPDQDYTQFVYDNDQAAADLGCDDRSLVGCDPSKVRFPSGEWLVKVVAVDEALVQSVPDAGELGFQVNYPPETTIVRDGTHPFWEADDGMGGTISQTFAPGDTVPVGATITFRSTGFDRRPESLPDPNPEGGDDYGCFCCDNVLDAGADQVKFQAQVKLVGSEGNRTRRFESFFSSPIAGGDCSFNVGPFAYTFLSRTEDEHQRKDRTPDTFQFVAGYRPRITSLSPADGESLILRDPAVQQFWPENEVSYQIPTSTTPFYWDGNQYHTSEGAGGRTRLDCHIFRLRPIFEGSAHPLEPNNGIKAWTYAAQSEFDEFNLILDSAAESPDLQFYRTSPQIDRWAFSDADAIEILVPSFIWNLPDAFDHDGNPPWADAALDFHVKQLGRVAMRVQGRTTSLETLDFQLFADLHNPTGSTAIPMARLGRRSDVSSVEFYVYLGIGATEITRLWPDDETFGPQASR